MKKKILLFLILIYSSVTASDVVRNGGGISEQNIIFAFEKLPEFLNICLSQNTCVTNESEVNLIESIVQSYNNEGKNNIVFKSERKNPGFFVIDGLEKIAITGNRVGDIIYVNTDLLYKKDKNEMTKFFQVSQAVQLLVHELGHHHGDYTHDFLDSVGARVRSFFEGRLAEVFYSPFIFDMSVLSLHGNSYTTNGILILNTGVELISLSKLFNVYGCPASSLGELNRLKNQKYHFYNISWKHDDGPLMSGKKSFSGTFVLMCEYENIGNHSRYHSFDIEFDISQHLGIGSVELKKKPFLRRIKPLYKVSNGNILKL
ncbi:hypothetical protein [Bacteriovorax sp. Seq25_V]|uniref:hypothetical protein n=1 Tax=Bacteriovorax sp. Seq25_V TaxID=1201288 RepID=UPI00038A1C73|nr:hypothetical protein [Bacteriovorax sp. Seq25_V]EQC43835.1 hypothetical protein M900_1516 [Bacteriovorax sp. Seq25_V]